MKLLKKLLVGSIILLLSTTFLVSAAQIKQNPNAEPVNTTEMNSLGKFVIRHWPLSPIYIKYKGMEIIEYTPPDDYIYEFPEDENGTVWMNFSLTIEHWLNNVGVYWAKFLFPNNFRFTCFSSYIFDDGIDYIFYDHCEDVPTNYSHEEFMIYMYAVGLKTNGQNKTLFVFIDGPLL